MFSTRPDKFPDFFKLELCSTRPNKLGRGTRDSLGPWNVSNPPDKFPDFFNPELCSTPP